MFKGTLIHVAFAIVLVLTAPLWLAVGAIFWYGEFKEFKSDIRGSIWEWDKVSKMIKGTFHWSVIPQWAAPGAAAYVVPEILKGIGL